MVRDKAEFLMKGANHPRISKTELMNFNIPIPPKQVQKEVVDIIEKVRGSGLNIMMNNLNILFDEYRGSVLHHAFIGDVDYSGSNPVSQIAAPK